MLGTPLRAMVHEKLCLPSWVQNMAMSNSILKKLRTIVCFCLPVIVNTYAGAQNSVLVNFGSTTCAAPNQPSFSLISNPFSQTPQALATCSMVGRVPDFFSVFIAYNPADNNVYIADNRTGQRSDVWRLNVGLPGRIQCPAEIPAAPTLSFPYVSNNFEFDSDGNLWSFTNYNINTGQCGIDKFDLVTGNVLQSGVIQFPAGQFPTTIFSGDLCILPNGRMFATLGDNPSRLYEILNYNSPGGSATAVHLLTLPANCYGIAYLNGELELTGTNLVNQCYYYRYSIANQSLVGPFAFQNEQAPIDNTSFTPAIGVTKRLLRATRVNENTGDITYEVYVRNMGNTILSDVNITEDLTMAFGAGNVSQVSVQFALGGNPANLQLNPAFNGVSNLQVLLPGQQLSNERLGRSDYFVTVEISCRVTNLQPGVIYLNSAIGTATINNEVQTIAITDSSNNGAPNMVDPNNDGNASGPGENVPTPFDVTALPVKFLQVQALLTPQGNALLQWQVATPTQHAKQFEPEFSTDGVKFLKLETLPISTPYQAHYRYEHVQPPPGALYYRIKQIDDDGAVVTSITMYLLNKVASEIAVFPNPGRQALNIIVPNLSASTPVHIRIIDAQGRTLWQQTGLFRQWHIPTLQWAKGVYRIVVQQGSSVNSLTWVLQ